MIGSPVQRAVRALRVWARPRERLGISVHRLPGDPRIDASRIDLGRHSYSFARAVVYDTGHDLRVTVGNFCSIGHDVVFLLDGGHRHDFVTTSPLFSLGQTGPPGHNAGASITVGHDVWIGREAMILPGVTIGTGAVIATRAVVTKDVAPYAIVAGNPARVVRRRFPDDECDLLLASCWWDWADDRVLAARDDLWSGDVHRFTERWGNQAEGPRNPGA